MPAAPIDPRAAAPGRELRVVIADDYPIFVDALRSFIDRDPRLRVVGVAGNGAEAVDAAVAEDADVVVCDVTMPLLDGYQVTARLRELRPHVPIILMSGYEDAEAAARAIDAGAAAFLPKLEVHERVISTILALARPTASGAVERRVPVGDDRATRLA